MNDITALKAFLTHLHEKYRNHHDGAVATYIPALAAANPDYFGISIASVDGQ